MALLRHKNTKKGQAIITATVLFLIISTTIILGISTPVYKEVRTIRDTSSSKASYFASESGQEDAIYRIKSNLQLSDLETLSLNNSVVTTTVLDNSGTKTITSNATTSSLVRKVQTTLVVGEGFAFNYGVQVGDGGLYMKNTSSIDGNVFASGSITTDNSPFITGDAISAGPNGLIDGVEVTGDAYANTIRNSDIGGDAYYQTISGTSVSGTSYPGSPDQATTTFPILDSTIEEWKVEAEAGGISTNCDISSSTTIGPARFNCDELSINGTPTITLAGPVWVTGDITFQNSADIVISGSLGVSSVAMIAHKESDDSGSGIITLKNSVEFIGPNNNFVLLVSMNNDAEANGGSTQAIQVQNSVDGDVLVYAPHGLIELKNSVDLKEVTAYSLELQNSAQVIYDTGLANLLFSSGPSGGYTIDSWKEVE
jgi:hypothetical protein